MDDVGDVSEAFTEQLARVVRLARTQYSLPAKLEAVVALAQRTIPNCERAGVTLLVSGTATSAAVSDTAALEIDLVQYNTGEGPCLSAICSSSHVRIDFLDRDTRFTRFAPGAMDLGVQSVLSIPLSADGATVGALNMYSSIPEAFDAHAEQLVEPLAAYASDVIANSPLYATALELMDGLMETVEEQATIYQAVGVLMSRFETAKGDALDRLREAALRLGLSLREMANRVLRGDLDAIST